jgi:hypothetical protein
VPVSLIIRYRYPHSHHLYSCVVASMLRYTIIVDCMRVARGLSLIGSRSHSAIVPEPYHASTPAQDLRPTEPSIGYSVRCVPTTTAMASTSDVLAHVCTYLQQERDTR